MRVLLDSSCLVAASLPQHEHHAATLAELDERRRRGDVFLMAGHALLEAYAVLTRLPPPHRISPADALAILEKNWHATPAIASTVREIWQTLRRNAAAAVAGGQIYDAGIAVCARKGKADQILTWNVRHFDRLPGPLPPAVSPRS